MKEYVKEVYKGFPFQYFVQKDRYWDKLAYGIVSADTVRPVEMDPYAGLGVETALNNGVMCMSINSGELPDHTVYEGEIGLVAPAGNYLVPLTGCYNFITVGAPQVDSERGILTGCSSSKYLTTPTEIEFGNVWEVRVRFRTASLVSSQIGVLGENTDQTGFRIGWTNGRFMLLCGDGTWFTTTEYKGSYVVKANTEYTIRAGCNGTLCYLDYVEGAFDESKNWIRDISYSASSAISTFAPRIGAYTLGGIGTGVIYLNDVKISVNGECVWTPQSIKTVCKSGLLASGLEDTAEAKTYNLFYKNGKVCLDTAAEKTDMRWVGTATVSAHDIVSLVKANFTKVGDVDFSDDGASFGSGGYLVANSLVPGSDYFAMNYEYILRVIPGYTDSTYRILAMVGELQIGIQGGQWFLCLGDVATAGSFTADTAYWVRVRRVVNGTSQTLYYMEDDGTYTLNTLPDVDQGWLTGPELAGSSGFVQGTQIEVGSHLANQAFKFVDLNNVVFRSRVSVDGSSWSTAWKALE